MSTIDLLDLSNAKLIIRLTKLEAKYASSKVENKLLKVKIEVFGIDTDWKRVSEKGKANLLKAIETARKVNHLKDCLKTV